MTGVPIPGRPVLAVTTGEPAGIGPELCAALAPRRDARLVLIGDMDLLRQRAQATPAAAPLQPFAAARLPPEGTLEVLHCPLARASLPGRLDAANARYVLATLDAAIAGCLDGRFDAMVTAPVHKAVINEAAIPFTGHTEYLAEHTGTRRVVMMLVGGGLRVALATTHLPLKDVAAAIVADELADTLRILHHDLRQRFRLAEPRILVAGLNPHAGEGGYLGREEIDVIEPVLEKLRGEGMRLVGPLPADTLFTPPQLAQGDCVLAMYHDQGLATLKYASFGGGVNVTLGLPIVRTSVDHGTALTLAGSGRADAGSLLAAVALARELAATGDGAR